MNEYIPWEEYEEECSLVDAAAAVDEGVEAVEGEWTRQSDPNESFRRRPCPAGREKITT